MTNIAQTMLNIPLNRPECMAHKKESRRARYKQVRDARASISELDTLSSIVGGRMRSRAQLPAT